MEAEKLLTTKEAAEYLRLSTAWLNKDRLSNATRFPYVKLGKTVRYRMSDILKAIDRHCVEENGELSVVLLPEV